MPESILRGQGAAPGLACGPVHNLILSHEPAVRFGSPQVEASALRAALDKSANELAALMQHCDPASAEVLEFQLAFVEDDTLLVPAFDLVRDGVTATKAWAQVLDTEIAHYQQDGNEYFRARAVDLADLRDRVLRALSGRPETPDVPPGSILLADDLPPSLFLALDWRQGGGIVLRYGSRTSHVAILARAKGVPMLVGVGGFSALEGQMHAMLDAEEGVCFINPSAESVSQFAVRAEHAREHQHQADLLLHRACFSRDGQRVEIHLNVADPAELQALAPEVCDGIGLVRTEFLFQNGQPLPDEETQFAIYAKLMTWARGRTVVVRTLDAGGDKPIDGLTLAGEGNPFLGVRGIRLTLLREDVLRVQLRALARATVLGPLWVMLPMVSVPDELARVHALLDGEIESLREAGVPAAKPALGIMVEVPSTAICIERFAADFYSIGSNDLIQYVMAAGRDSAHLSALHDPSDPAVLSLIANVVACGERQGRSVSLCGDAAAELEHLPALLATGLRKLSVGLASVGRVKAAIAGLDLGASAARGKA